MTREEIEALSGQDLDLAVAQQFMGYKVGYLEVDPEHADDDWDYTTYRNNATGETMSGLAFRSGMAMIGRIHLPKYSSDLRAAWDVVNKLIKEYRVVFGHEFENDPWEIGANAHIEERMTSSYFAVAPEFEVAVCRLALFVANDVPEIK